MTFLNARKPIICNIRHAYLAVLEIQSATPLMMSMSLSWRAEMTYQQFPNIGFTNILKLILVVILLQACSKEDVINVNDPVVSCENQGSETQSCFDPAPASAPAKANNAPTTAPVTLTAINEDSGIRVITQAELLTNASDADGDALNATGLVITSGIGALIDNGNGTWSYTPAANDDTSVTFAYGVTDGAQQIAGIATMDILPVSEPGNIRLSWVAPSVRSDNITPLLLSEIAGYRIYYGTAPGLYPNQVNINDGSVVQKTLNNMSPGAYYFVLTTIDMDGRESSFSNMVTVNI
jgi:hypothetical protein